MAENYLLIADLQLPFEAEGALDFYRRLKRQYRVKDEHCYCVGDEIDAYFGGLWDKDPNALYSPNSELSQTIDKLKLWYEVFPLMKLATSNHGMRWVRKATAAQIPTQLLRSYREIIQAPTGWQWKDCWTVEGSKHKFLVKHGMEYGGMYAFRHAPMIEGMSVAFGHLHTVAGIAYIRNVQGQKWGMCVGCTINDETFAFNYAKWHRFKPIISGGIVLNGGSTPLIVPMNNA